MARAMKLREAGRRWGGFCTSCVALTALLAGVASGAEEKPALTTEAVQQIQAKYRAEHDEALKGKQAEKFAPEALRRAEQLGQRGDAALAAGRLAEAAEAFHEARWLLPAL